MISKEKYNFHRNTIYFQFNGRVSIALKSLFLAWLLLPIAQNGSSVLFDLVLAPVHDTVLQLSSDTKDLALSGLAACLDDILQPLVTWTLNTAEAGLRLVQLAILQGRGVVTPPLSCAGAILLNSPGLLLTSIADTGNSMLDLINILSLYIYDFLNSLLSYSNNCLHLLASVAYSIFEEVLVLFEDPINVIIRYSWTAVSSYQYLTTKVTEYYQYNKRNPIFFSDLFKGIRNIVIQEALTIQEKIYTVLEKFTQVLSLKVLTVAEHFFSDVNNLSRVSFNIVYQWFSKLQPALTELFHYFRIIYDFITECLNSFIFSFQNCLGIFFAYVLMFLNEIVRLSFVVYEAFHDLTIFFFKSISSHIYQNQKQPRLFSQLFKQMIRQIK